MKKQMGTSLIIRSSLALALALALAIWSPLQAQSAEPAEGKMMTEFKMMERCQEGVAREVEATIVKIMKEAAKGVTP